MQPTRIQQTQARERWAVRWGSRMRRGLAAAGLALAGVAFAIGGGVGCSADPEPEPQPGPVQELPLNSFTRGWSIDLDLDRGQPAKTRKQQEARDAVTELHVTDDAVYAYTRDGEVASIGRESGALEWTAAVRGPSRFLYPPVPMKGRIAIPTRTANETITDPVVFPTGGSLEIYDRFGRLYRSFQTPFAVATPAVGGRGPMLYLGGSFGGSIHGSIRGSSRLVALDVTRPNAPAIWELMIPGGTLDGAPAFVEDVVYAASEDGSVYAVNAEDREPVWPIEGAVFKTGGRIVCDIVADDSGVYVASTDTKLYALNRNSGRIRWVYYAGRQLRDAPVVTNDMVYQAVPNAGIAAIPKNEGDTQRQPRWLIAGARQFLASDARYAYLLNDDRRIIAVDKNTGAIAFQSQRNDLDVYATSTRNDGVIYAATKSGWVLSIRPVLKPGGVGELVRAPARATEAVASAR